MPIDNVLGFIHFGTAPNNMTLSIPYPSSAPFETARTVTMQDSSDGSIVAQQVGRSRDKQSMSWKVMNCEKWWEINNWIETNGMFFYCRYFNFNRGIWQTRKFYCSNISCEPFFINNDTDSPDYGKPAHLQNCTLNVIDMGEVGT